MIGASNTSNHSSFTSSAAAAAAARSGLADPAGLVEDEQSAAIEKLGGGALLSAGAQPALERLRVLIAEPLGAAATAELSQLDASTFDVHMLPDLKQTPAELTESTLSAIKDFVPELLVVRGNCKVDQAFIERLSGQKRPSSVLRAGTGMDNIASAYLKGLGIKAQNTASVNTQSTAEHAVALMLAAARKVPIADAQVKAGVWDRQALTGSDLGGKTLGVVGVGNIGKLVGQVAKALGMTVIGVAPPSHKPGDEIPACFTKYTDLDELCRESDVLTLHVPLTDKTRGMIGKKQLDQMAKGGKKGILINTARGGLVDEAAVFEALEDGRLAAAGIDVFGEDPAPQGSLSDRLARHPKVVATPHVGGQTREASQRMGQAVVDEAQRMKKQRTESALKAD